MLSEYARPALVKLYVHAGFDFLYIEYEHGFFDLATFYNDYSDLRTAYSYLNIDLDVSPGADPVLHPAENEVVQAARVPRHLESN